MKNRDLIKDEVRKIQQDIFNTQIKKEKFISEITNGLGQEILKEPNIVQKKLSFWSKLKKMFFIVLFVCLNFSMSAFFILIICYYFVFLVTINYLRPLYFYYKTNKIFNYHKVFQHNKIYM